MSKKNVVWLLVLLALVGSAGAYYAMRRTAAEPQVTTAPVTRGDLVDSVGATGTLQAVTTVQVGTQVSGTIQNLYADFNSIVHKGQVIARLDPSLFQTQIEQARATLSRSEADVERLRVALEDAQTKQRRAEELAARKLLPQSELDAARIEVRSADAQLKSSLAQVTQSRASLNQNDVNLQHTVITAPIDGIVISRNVDIGQTVAASMQAPTLFVLAADLTKMQVNASVDEADVGRIRPNQSVRFRVDAYPSDEFTGRVSQVRLQPVVIQNVVTYATVIDVPNSDLKLKPGMTATVTIEIDHRTDVIRVPNSALRFRPTADIFAALNQSPPAPMTPGAPATQAETQAARTDSAATMDRMRGRMVTMSPEDRQKFLARMRERGFDLGGVDAGAAGRTGPPAVEPGATTKSISTQPGATTVDSLFGPLPPVESVGRVWLYANRQLKPVRLRLGISDGTNTALLSGELQPGTELVTAIVTGSVTTNAAPARSPLMGPQRPGGTGRPASGGTR